MRSKLLLILWLLVWAPTATNAQTGIRGQIYLPNGSPIQRQTRFTLATDNGMRHEIFYSDSNGRIAMPTITAPYTITVESDGESYDTTVVSFIPMHAGNYIVIHLRPLKNKPPAPPGVVDLNDVDISVSPKAREAYESATKLLQAGQLEKAIEPLKRAVSIQSNYFHAYNDLGVVYMKLNRLDEAADALRHAIKINDRIYLPQLNLGIVLNRQGKFQEAAEFLTKLQKNDPNRAAIHPPLIEALMGAKLWTQAEEELNKALTLRDADVVDLKIKLGTVMIRSGKFSEAAIVLREAVAAEPDNALAQFSLGTALLQSGALDQAETSLRRAYELKGSSMAGAQLLLGQLYFQKKDYSKAIESFEAYLRDLPDAPNAAQVKEAIRKLRQSTGKP